MLDATANALADHILAILPANRPHPRGDLDALPRPLTDYLGSVLDRRADQKAPAPESPWLNADNHLVTTARKVWKTAARAAAQFPDEAWIKAVRTASRQVLNYLVEPVETLVSFAYTDTETVLELDALQERMAAFSPYPYFREVAKGYVARKALDGIDRGEFEKLLQRIDRRMVDRFVASDWLTLLEPLFELVRVIPDHKDGVSGSALKRFFAAKGFDDIASELDDAEVYNREGLRKVLNRMAAPVMSAGNNAARETIAGATPETAKGEELAPEIVEGDGAEPLWKRLAREQHAVLPLPDAVGDEIEDAEIVEETDIAAADDEEPEPVVEEEEDRTGEEPLWKRFADAKKEKAIVAPGISTARPGSSDPAPKVRPEPLLHLEMRVLGSTATERRDWYAQQLTGGSEAAYRSILEELDRARNWKEAWPILKEAYQANKVEIYSDAIVAFTDAVETRFAG